MKEKAKQGEAGHAEDEAAPKKQQQQQQARRPPLTEMRRAGMGSVGEYHQHPPYARQFPGGKGWCGMGGERRRWLWFWVPRYWSWLGRESDDGHLLAVSDGAG